MSAVEIRRWTREEYYRMLDAGVFALDERVELIDGEIFKMPPQNSPHATAIHLAQEVLRSAFGPGYAVRQQFPLAIDPLSEPEPDIAVVVGTPRDYRDAHPSSAILVVEVAEATLRHDRERKGSLYARAGIADYWIVNLIERRLEVHRDPVPANEARYGWEYRTVQHYTAGLVVAPLAMAQARIAVDDLLL